MPTAVNDSRRLLVRSMSMNPYSQQHWSSLRSAVSTVIGRQSRVRNKPHFDCSFHRPAVVLWVHATAVSYSFTFQTHFDNDVQLLLLPLLQSFDGNNSASLLGSDGGVLSDGSICAGLWWGLFQLCDSIASITVVCRRQRRGQSDVHLAAADYQFTAADVWIFIIRPQCRCVRRDTYCVT